MKYKAICFDVDGTLYPAEIMNKKMARWTLIHPIRFKKYEKTRKAFREYQDSFDKLDLMNADFGTREAAMYVKANRTKLSVSEARQELDKHFYAYLRATYKSLPAQPEVEKTFSEIKNAGIKIGIFSDWPFYSKLENIGVGKYIDFGATSDNVGYLKPSIKCFEYMLENMHLDASEVLYVGDSYLKDVLGATDAGIDAVLIGKADSGKYTKALGVFENWAGFDSWLKNLMEVDK